MCLAVLAAIESFEISRSGNICISEPMPSNKGDSSSDREDDCNKSEVGDAVVIDDGYVGFGNPGLLSNQG